LPWRSPLSTNNKKEINVDVVVAQGITGIIRLRLFCPHKILDATKVGTTGAHRLVSQLAY
ncbi:MAG: hypothetical protein ACJA0F_002562, partial [Dinoroseobacter sp.]